MSVSVLVASLPLVACGVAAGASKRGAVTKGILRRSASDLLPSSSLEEDVEGDDELDDELNRLLVGREVPSIRFLDGYMLSKSAAHSFLGAGERGKTTVSRKP